MAAIAAVADRAINEEVDAKTQLLISLARTMAFGCSVVALVHTGLLALYLSPWQLVNIVEMAAMVGTCVGSMALARRGHLVLATWLLVAGSTTVIGIGVVITAGAALSILLAVPVVLAGLLLRRRCVFALAAAVSLLFVLHVATGGMERRLVAPGELNMYDGMVTAVLSMILLLSLLASEYTGRLGLAMDRLRDRAVDLERSRQQLAERARQLETAREQAESHARQLEAARVEIERKRDVSLGVASEIHAMARGLADTSTQQASGSTEQAAAMAEIVATMEELSRAATQIASSSSRVSDLAVSALGAAQTGRDSVDETIAALDVIRSEVRSVAEKNLTLGQKTQAIGEIIELITEIADRTHLLALNAAIESAAAGEYGRRFGVVAGQVKELASESKSAAHQVRSAVAEIQRAASATVLAAEKGEAQVDAGVRLGRGAGDALMQIVEGVQEVAVAAKEMLLATQQQQSASEQVVSTVREVEQVTRQSAEGSRQISQTVHRLVGSAELLS